MGLTDRSAVAQTQQAWSVLRPIVFWLLVRTTAMIVLLTGAYYTWPTRSPAEDVTSAVRLGGALLSGALVAVVVVAQLRARRHSPRPVRTIEGLLTSFYFLVVAFASLYYGIARSTDQFSGLETKTDGLYFTVTIVSTVGFGDIHAAGTAARALVTAQMLFGIIYIGTAIRVLSGLGSRMPLVRDPDRPET